MIRGILWSQHLHKWNWKIVIRITLFNVLILERENNLKLREVKHSSQGHPALLDS